MFYGLSNDVNVYEILGLCLLINKTRNFSHNNYFVTVKDLFKFTIGCFIYN